MKTKAEIIQKLLDEKHIQVEEAMVLMEKEKEYVYLNYPYYHGPFWSISPYVSTPFGSTGGNICGVPTALTVSNSMN